MEAWREELYHHGILGQKWGVRRYQNIDGSYTSAGKKRREYQSTNLRSAIAKSKNAKVDKKFKEWKENDEKKADAINKGINANDKRLAYELDNKNRELKREYKQANREYKKALNSNTTYRQGSVREAVGKDASKKYLSEAKKIEKLLNSDPYNRNLQKQYSNLMSKYDIERSKARRAQDVAAKRSYKIASLKRAMTMTVKAAATTAAIGVGVYAANKYILNNSNVKLNTDTVANAVNIGKKVMSYMY